MNQEMNIKKKTWQKPVIAKALTIKATLAGPSGSGDAESKS